MVKHGVGLRRLGQSLAHPKHASLGARRLAVIGTGLIGASVGLAAKRAGADAVTGYDSDPEALAVAATRNAVDVAARTLTEAVAEAELVVVATPVGGAAAQITAALEASAPDCTVTDVGSTKGRVCSALAGSDRFVGGHPMSGSETTGPGGARVDLFDGATWFLTPLPETAPAHLSAVENFVSCLGAAPVRIDPDEHDRLLALVSHLPHALANLLVQQVGAARVENRDPLALAGASFRDMTRVAGANGRVWTDIFLDNAPALIAVLADHRRLVEKLESALRDADQERLLHWIDEIARLRGSQ